jgi:hypothetical protein
MPKSQLKHHSQPRHTTDPQVPFPLTPSYYRGVYPVIHTRCSRAPPLLSMRFYISMFDPHRSFPCRSLSKFTAPSQATSGKQWKGARDDIARFKRNAGFWLSG